MKKDTRPGHIPVVMLTGDRSRAAVRRSIDTGAAGYLAKRFELEALVTKVSQALARREQDLASPELTTLIHGDLL